MILAGGYIVRAWKSAIAQSAGIRRLLKGQVRRLQILVLQIRGEIVGHHNRVVSLIEVRQIPSVFVEATPNRPAQAITQDRKSTRLNSSHLGISYAVFC